MLSRRLLRIKVMQTLYALRQIELANQQVAINIIEQLFQPDLNSMEPQNLQQLEGYRRLATVLFEEGVQNGSFIEEDETPANVRKAAYESLLFYRHQLAKARHQIRQAMIDEVRTLDDTYIRLLTLLLEITHVAQIDRDRERSYADPNSPLQAEGVGLDQNRIICSLKEHKPLNTEAIRRGISWTADMSVVRAIYYDTLKQDDQYRAYCQLKGHTIDDDQQIVQHIVRGILLKQNPSKNYFEEKILGWAENGEIVRSMTIKTLKSVQTAEGLKLVELTENWEEDQAFLETLYNSVIENDQTYESLLAEQLTNWDVERVALLDKIILKLAVCELLTFPSIPIKVSINEYIEIAKAYSTPKSGKFVNGVLDSLSEKLKNEGKLRKSGRGLLDNR